MPIEKKPEDMSPEEARRANLQPQHVEERQTKPHGPEPRRRELDAMNVPHEEASREGLKESPNGGGYASAGQHHETNHPQR